MALDQTGPCWLVTTEDQRYAYTANAGGGSISSFSIRADGALTLLDSTAAEGLAHPTDLGISANGKFLYIREEDGSIGGFRVESDGRLTSVGSFVGIPSDSEGIAVR